MKEILTQEKIMNLLDETYKKCISGIPKVSESIEDMANGYLEKYETKEEACKAMLKNQVLKCCASGFLTGIGGIVTMPISLSANITSLLYVQMRMIACTAYIAGYDLKSDHTQTFVYCCLAGISINSVLKQAGIKLTTKLAKNTIKKIPSSVLKEINDAVGIRLITKFGDTGIINLGKCVPFLGALVGGGFDYGETRIIADRAYKWFIEN